MPVASHTRDLDRLRECALKYESARIRGEKRALGLNRALERQARTALKRGLSSAQIQSAVKAGKEIARSMR